MVIDVIDLITPAPSFRQSSYKDGNHPSICYVSQPDENGIIDIVEIKGLKGEPWDWMKADAKVIRQLLTENIWGDPSSGKLTPLLGVPRFPRYIDYSPNQPAGSWALPDMDSPQTDYMIYGAGGKTATRNSNGIVRCTFAGPFPGPAIVDPQTGKVSIPAGNDWTLSYERGGQKQADGSVHFGAKEILTHRETIGRWKWQQFPASGGVYAATPDAQSQTVTIKPMPNGGVLPVQHVF